MNSFEHVRARMAVAAVELLASVGCLSLSAYFYSQYIGANNSPRYAVTQANPATPEPEQTIYNQYGQAILFCTGMTYQDCYTAAYPPAQHRSVTRGKANNNTASQTANNVSVNNINTQAIVTGNYGSR